MSSRALCAVMAVTGVALAALAAGAAGRVALPEKTGPIVLESLSSNLVASYGFEEPVPGAPARERDHGFSGTDIDLVNGVWRCG
jgi:hypothetical protein